MLDPPPHMLALFGREDLAGSDAVVILGARNASAAERKIARDIAGAFVMTGFAFVSGIGSGN